MAVPLSGLGGRDRPTGAPADYLIVLLTAESVMNEMVRGEIEISRDQAAKTSTPLRTVHFGLSADTPTPEHASELVADFRQNGHRTTE